MLKTGIDPLDLSFVLLLCFNPERQVSVAVLLDSFVAASLELEVERSSAASAAAGNPMGYAHVQFRST